MRVITRNSINAFYNRKDFKSGNMSVHTIDSLHNGNKIGTTTFLSLHNNKIAKLVNGVLWISNAGWNSNTTKERLNALDGVSIVQKNWVWYLNGVEWDGSWIKIG